MTLVHGVSAPRSARMLVLLSLRLASRWAEKNTA